MTDQIISQDTATLAEAKNCPVLRNLYNITLEGIVPYKECTQSLLQRWLRETQHIEIYVRRDGYGGYVCHVEYDTAVKSGSESLSAESSYEESLEEGLKKALTLIQ